MRFTLARVIGRQRRRVLGQQACPGCWWETGAAQDGRSWCKVLADASDLIRSPLPPPFAFVPRCHSGARFSGSTLSRYTLQSVTVIYVKLSAWPAVRSQRLRDLVLCCSREVVARGLDDLPDSAIQLIAQHVGCFDQRWAILHRFAFRNQRMCPPHVTARCMQSQDPLGCGGFLLDDGCRASLPIRRLRTCRWSASYERLSSTMARRKDTLPLISKRWARLLRGPSHAWQAVIIGHEDTAGTPAKRLDPAAALTWFSNRSG